MPTADQTKTAERTAEIDAAQPTKTQHSFVQSPAVKKIIEAYNRAFTLSVEYVQWQWQLAARLYELWRGKLPAELDGTFSKIMLNVGHAVVQDRIPRLHDNIFAREDSVVLDPQEPLYELFKSQAEDWLRYKINHPSQLNMPGDFLRTTLPATCIYGTSYRMPYVFHWQNPKGKWIPEINSKHVDFFQILPSPNGGLVNPLDRYAEEAMDYFFYVDWWTQDQINSLAKYEGFKPDEVEACLSRQPSSHGQFDNVYVRNYSVIGGVSYGGSKDDWRVRMNDIDGVSGRRRVVTWFQRDRMTIVAQDQFVIYDGPNPMPNRLLPLVTYYTCPDGTNFFGISALEMVEDIIRAMMMNFNFRMDYLAQVMFPAKWIRSDVLGGKPLSDFQDRPYAVHEFPVGIDIRQALHIDRMPEITQQTFQDEQAMKTFLQDIGGLSDYTKGAPSRLSDNRTATGIVSLIQQAQGRLTSESFMLESFGLAQECRLLLAMGQKWIFEDMRIRVSRPDSGFVWATVESQAIADKYTIHTTGTRYMQQREQSFQKLMALYPLWNQDPYIDQLELRRELAEATGVLRNSDRLIQEPEQAGAMMEAGEMGQQEGNPMQGMSGSMTPNNRQGRMQQRNRAEPAARTY